MKIKTVSAAILAGGKSERMGTDKALLRLDAKGLPLWQKQVETLRALKPIEILWSGPGRSEIFSQNPPLRLVPDHQSGCGPFAGIFASLEQMQSRWLVVLAVDLPLMTSSLLGLLIEQSGPNFGAVITLDSYFEPLAAVYPLEILPLMAAHGQRESWSLQELLNEAVARNLMRSFPCRRKDIPLFKNLNSPQDCRELNGSGQPFMGPS